MITTLRKHVKSTASSVVIWVGVLGIMGVFSLPMLIKNMRNSGLWAIKVNNHEISRKTYDRTVADYQEYISRLRAQYGQFAEYLNFNIDPQSIAFESLVYNELVIQLAQKLGFFVDHEFVIQKLQDSVFVQQYLADIVPSFLMAENGGINHEILPLYLARRKMSMSEFEDAIVNGILKYITMSLLQESVYLPKYDIAYKMRMDNASRTFSILHFPLDIYIKKEADTVINQEEIESFYNTQNAETKRYWVPEKRSGTVWVFEPKRYDLAISSDAIQAFYDEHKATMYVESPAKVQVRKLAIDKDFSSADGETAYEFITKKREYLLENPDAFTDLVKQFSTDTNSAKKGGLLDPIVKKNQNDPIERAAFSLSESGDVSNVVETQDSYVLLQLVEKIAKTIKPLSSVKDEIKAKLLDSEFKELFAKEVQSILLPQGGYDQEKLEAFIKNRGGIKETISLTPNNEKSSRVRALFGLKSGDIQFLSEGKKGVVIRLDSVERAYLPEWTRIADDITLDIKVKRARESQNSDIQKAVLELKEQDASSVANIYGVSVQNESLTGGDLSKKGTLFEKMGISESEVKKLEKIGSVYVHIGKESVDLVRLNSIDTESFDALSESGKEQQKAIYSAYQQKAIQGLVASLYRTAKIETNEIVSNSTEDILYE